jgi:Fe-Mn family superoxide dismutase
VRAQSAPRPFKLGPLAYPFTALEQYIDARTMEIHHNLHDQAYVTNLNNAAKDNPIPAAMPLHDLLGQLSQPSRPLQRGGRAPVRLGLCLHDDRQGRQACD